MKKNLFQKAIPHIILSLLLTTLRFAADASDFHTATKSGCFAAPCEVTGTNSFAIPAGGQTVKWSATWTDMAPHGNDFYLSNSGPNMADILVDGNLTGFNGGELFLTAGNYFIAIQTTNMGEGSYTIEFNRTPNCNVSPASHNFGNHNAGSAGADFDFDLTLAGDLLDVEIGSITSSDPHFVISGGTGTTLHSPSPMATSFNVQFNPGASAGTFTATITIDTPIIGGINPSNKTVTVTGTTVALVPNIDCVSSVTFTLDWFAATPTVTGTFTKSFNNEGNATMNITSVALTSNAGGVFSIIGGPYTAPLTAGSSRAVTIQFTVPAVAASENFYNSSLRIVSNSPGEETHDCAFQARAHHPEPIMDVSVVPDGGTTANYHDVETGFTYTKGIKVRNTGDAPLSMTLTRTTPGDADWAQWTADSEVANAPITIAAGSERIFREFFKPLVIGTYTTEMTAVGTGGSGTYNRTDNLTLTGNGINPTPMDNVLVLDKSGSMADPAGSRTKIDAMQKAARLYYDLLRPDPGDGSGDQFGMIKYSSDDQPYLSPLQMKNAANEPGVLDLLSEAAITDAARLLPDGTTCIGCGMETGASLLTASPDTRKQIMVVMTDGIQNEDPRVNDVLGPIESANPDLMIYSVGLGDDIEESTLQQITNIGNGYHQVSEDLLGTNHFALEEFYL
jgi:hypothetical protein